MGSVKRKNPCSVEADPLGSVQDGRVGSSSSSIPDGAGEASSSTSVPEGSDCDFMRLPQPLHGRITGPKRRSTKGQWTPEEDEVLCRAVHHYHGKNWKKIAECFPGRSDVQCLHRWQKVLNPTLIKGPWSKEEDEIIIEMVNKVGPKKWSTIAQALPGRIGKQCRERWHNHLNPAINKEAWTQEEEVALIHAHKIYGNKWAELTKFLPGSMRCSTECSTKHWFDFFQAWWAVEWSDNSIKNHWNSSVKKKLESYMFQDLIERHPSLPSTARIRQKNNANCFKERPDIEDSSDCSSSALVASSSQSLCEMVKPVMDIDNNNQGDVANKVDTSNSNLQDCSAKLYGSVEETVFGDPSAHNVEMQVESSSTETLLPKAEGPRNEEQLSSKDTDYEKEDSLHYKPSLESFEIETKDNHWACQHNGNVLNMHSCSINAGSDTVTCVQNGSGTTMDCVPCSYSLLPVNTSDMFALQCCQSFNTMPLSFICESDNVQNQETFIDVQNPGCTGPLIHDVLISNEEHTGQQNEVNETEEMSTKTMTCGDRMNDYIDEHERDLDPGILPIAGETKDVQTKEFADSGSLFYEPPRIQSMEFPFVCCDIVSSDLQQAYSPLGIRQLMLSSSSCSLWDSPSRDDSPDEILKYAAKSFICTPSIMKKRQRELTSPLQERRPGKKPASDLNRGSFATSLSRGGDVSMEDMIGEVDCEKIGISSTHVIDSELKSKPEITEQNTNHGDKRTHKNSSSKFSRAINLQQSMDYRFETSATTDEYAKKHQCNRVLKERNCTDLEPISCGTFISPGACGSKHVEGSIKATCLQYPPSSKKPQVSVEKFTPSVDADHPTLNIFADTPGIKVGLDSPSAWKSPFFLNSYLAGTDMACEDFRYFMSPGERSYDALGLMKQLSEQNANVMAEAQEVLCSGGQKLGFDAQSVDFSSTPEMEEFAKEQENLIPMPSNIVAEGRVLDFSGCTTPHEKSRRAKLPISGTSSQLLRGCR